MLQFVFEYSPKFNSACFQNAYALIRSLRIENTGETALSELTLTLRTSPAFANTKTWSIDKIEANGTVDIPGRDLEIDPAFLSQLTESTQGSLKLSLGQGAVSMLERVYPIEILSSSEWGGVDSMPEILAAFTTPNEPEVAQILRSASDILREAGKKDSLEGYQSNDKKRVWEIGSAIYTAIANLDLRYAEPPASFERSGQKIRSAAQILSEGLATCLDLSLLFAACLEQAGLNPILVLPKGHACIALWLEKGNLPQTIVHDAEILRKCQQLKKIILFETTLVTQHPTPSISQAFQATQDFLLPEKDAEFVMALDLQCARTQKIRPISSMRSKPMHAGQFSANAQAFTAEPDWTEPAECVVPAADESPATRLDRWKLKLLDLSLRNPLLNHRSSTGCITILCPDPGKLEDKLAAGIRISLISRQKMAPGNIDACIYRQRNGASVDKEIALAALDKNQILADLPDADLQKRSVDIYRKAQSALQEGGSNTLFLAIGYLLWKKDPQDTQKYRAPLILLPVSLERTSVRSGVKLLINDDDPRFNTTLLEMLRKDYGIDIKGLDGVLPTDESGIDVPGIWNLVRKAIHSSPGFEVVEDTVLGHFSFAKYLMWKDLAERSDSLRNNPVVKHLIETPREPFFCEIPFVNPRELDRNYHPVDLLTPLPADASQMSVIATADKGKNFVVIGPPGTGKSQTISNLVAHLLGKGKRVLFVSEKTAALEVVYRRLADVGLGSFCLELHSSKASKSDVLRQLRQSWEMSKPASVTQWEAEATRLKDLRDKLNRLVEHLHTPHRNGLTPYQAMGTKIQGEQWLALCKFHWDHAGQHEARQLEQMRETSQRLGILAQTVAIHPEHPLAVIQQCEWSPLWQSQLLDCCAKWKLQMDALRTNASAFAQVLDMERLPESLPLMKPWISLAQSLLDCHRVSAEFALESTGRERIEILESTIAHLHAFIDLQGKLGPGYSVEAWKTPDLDALGLAWQESSRKWFIPRFLEQRTIKKRLRQLGATGSSDPQRDLDLLRALRQEGLCITKQELDLSAWKEWRGVDTDPAKARQMVLVGKALRQSLAELGCEPQQFLQVKSKIRLLVQDGNEMLAPSGSVGALAARFKESYRNFDKGLEDFSNLACITPESALKDLPPGLSEISSALDNIISHGNELKDWCNWQKRRQEAQNQQMHSLVHALEQGHIPPAKCQEVFEAAYCAWWSGAILGEDEVLRTFTSGEHDEDIRLFRTVDQHFCKLTSQYIAAQLHGRRPGDEEIKRGPQWGVLRRELEKKIRHKPVRQLIQEASDALLTLAPCFMMSPLSIAQYLPSEIQLFDAVIFDEASQITVWDAIGAIARGKQVIVAGDPRQMPPTNFFARANDDDEEDAEVESDLESILDEMLGASIPKQVLNLHYRSRKESLIAFSNQKYYGNQLITFPAPIPPPDQGVSWVETQGCYDRGKNRNNEGEARAVVAEVVRRLTHSDERVRQQSIGIVTFNMQQQTLIEDLLDAERAAKPELEWAFSRDTVLEPVFVKNLETVQGDERDVILFSITFGPDSSGHVSMNFGPLNRAGGERRLNVALTRARSEMVVFSTLRPEHIDMARTKASAIHDLKHFLEYAHFGPSVLGNQASSPLGVHGSPFERSVALALAGKGWKIVPQVGVSSYRIDLGVIHPDRPGEFLVGLECDGAMYHSSPYARERDHVRRRVLEGLGWKIMRVWSTDWWIDSAKSISLLHDRLTNLRLGKG